MGVTVTQIKTLEKIIYVIPAVGCSKEDVSVKTDQKEDKINSVYVNVTEPNYYAEALYDLINFEFETKIDVDFSYDVRTCSVEVINGLILIAIFAHKDRIKSVTVK